MVRSQRAVWEEAGVVEGRERKLGSPSEHSEGEGEDRVEKGAGSLQELLIVFREPSPRDPSPKAQHRVLSSGSFESCPTPSPTTSSRDSGAPPRVWLCPGRGGGCEAAPEAAPLPLHTAWLYIALPLPLLIG